MSSTQHLHNFIICYDKGTRISEQTRLLSNARPFFFLKNKTLTKPKRYNKKLQSIHKNLTVTLIIRKIEPNGNGCRTCESAD